ncbi:MAG: HAMP domain-containing sensor histidine kinase [Reyranella sp.]|nr:HAMP domain-containing sensor histidine kinase [Reyranella sp.]
MVRGPGASPDFAAYLRHLNARRLRSASWFFAAVVALLLVVNIALPALQLWPHAIVQAVVVLYFVCLGFVCRSPQAARWPTPAMPLLFGLATIATGLVFAFDLAPRLGANPAYATALFVACLAPVWPPRLLLAVLVPAHLLYLMMVFSVAQPAPFALLMSIGGTLAVALGGFVATLQYRTGRHAFKTAETIRRQKDELAEALARVNRLLEERGEMVATVAHDLQSPLAGIRALLRTIPDLVDGDGPKLREIARTCADMQSAIARLLDAHAAESGQVEFVVVDLEKLFATISAAVAPAAAEKGIAVMCDAEGLYAWAEPALLARALGNLLSNAVKFSPAGAMVRLVARSRGPGVRVSVIDRGPGLAPDEAALLFRKFTRLGAQPTGGEPTSGLGLYIVQSLARRMQAVVGFEPNPEGGSVFFLDLDAAAPAALTPSGL